MARAIVMLAALVGAGVIAAAPAGATPQCRFGPQVTADCPNGCPDDPAGQAATCTGPLLEPMWPEPLIPFEIELGGGSGSGGI